MNKGGNPSPWLLLAVAATLLGSYAYFWHARDWNVSSRLMLTYAMADRGTVSIDGLEDHTRDRARAGGHFYSDKAPGLAIAGLLPYAVARVAGLPPHPLDLPGKGFTHWPGDYWVTLATSGLSTIITAMLLVWLAAQLGCGPAASALVGLSYGLATPAFVYATLAYGHQLATAALLGSLSLVLTSPGRPGQRLRASTAGFLCGWALLTELQLGPVAAVVGLTLLVWLLTKRLPWAWLPAFVAGLAGPLILLACYNQLAFGSPLALGYFHEDLEIFRDVHNTNNPLGLHLPTWSNLAPLLWGRYRGLLFYAPILTLAVPGWLVLAGWRRWGVMLTTLGACGAVLLVNLSYPEWTGGWCTGPRLLIPLIPFAMVAVAGCLAAHQRFLLPLALVLSLWGWALMMLFQGAGGRFSQDVADPLLQMVWPAWRNGELCRTIVDVLAPSWVAGLPPSQRWVSFLPLVAFQTLGFSLVWLLCRPANRAGVAPAPAPEGSGDVSTP